MKTIFKILISDFIEKDLEQVYFRELLIPLESSKIITISGARRVGKTYLLYSLVKKLRKNHRQDLLVYINFEDERFFPFRKEYLNDFIEAYYELFPANKHKKVYFFFDEIQNIPQWELFIRRIYDNENCRIYLSGSSSKMFSSDIATALRGRTLNYELFPLSFNEYLKIKSIEPNFYSSKKRAVLLNAFDYYINNTSFPELIHFSPGEMKKALREFYDLLIYKDIIDRYKIGNTIVIKYLAKFLILNTGNLISYNKLYNDIKSQGYRFSRNTIYEYIDYLHDSYSVFPVSLFTENIKEQNRNPRKLYCLDNGLKNLLALKNNIGRNLENLVFLQLRRKYKDIYYFKGKQEIDFCIKDENNKIILINVSFQIDTKSTFEREISGLKEGMEYFNPEQAYLITYEKEDIIKTNKGAINIIPIWKWLLY